MFGALFGVLFMTVLVFGAVALTARVVLGP